MRQMSKAKKAEQYDETARQSNRLDLMLSDVMNESVTWGRWIANPEWNGAEWLSSGKYRAGISRMNSYPLVMIIWRCAGQRDSVRVYDLEPYEDNLFRMRARSEAYQPEIDAILSARQALPKGESNAA